MYFDHVFPSPKHSQILLSSLLTQFYLHFPSLFKNKQTSKIRSKHAKNVQNKTTLLKTVCMILNSDLHYLLWQGNVITHPVTLEPEVILTEPTLLVSSSSENNQISKSPVPSVAVPLFEIFIK